MTRRLGDRAEGVRPSECGRGWLRARAVFGLRTQTGKVVFNEDIFTRSDRGLCERKGDGASVAITTASMSAFPITASNDSVVRTWGYALPMRFSNCVVTIADDLSAAESSNSMLRTWFLPHPPAPTTATPTPPAIANTSLAGRRWRWLVPASGSWRGSQRRTCPDRGRRTLDRLVGRPRRREAAGVPHPASPMRVSRTCRRPPPALHTRPPLGLSAVQQGKGQSAQRFGARSVDRHRLLIDSLCAFCALLRARFGQQSLVDGCATIFAGAGPCGVDAEGCGSLAADFDERTGTRLLLTADSGSGLGSGAAAGSGAGAGAGLCGVDPAVSTEDPGSRARPYRLAARGTHGQPRQAHPDFLGSVRGASESSSLSISSLAPVMSTTGITPILGSGSSPPCASCSTGGRSESIAAIASATSGSSVSVCRLASQPSPCSVVSADRLVASAGHAHRLHRRQSPQTRAPMLARHCARE